MKKEEIKLTKEEKFLKELGYLEEDFKQIKEAKKNTIYTNTQGERLTQKQVLKILGLEGYLIGLSRSAFHWTSSKDGVYFDSSKMFKAV